MRTYGRSGSGCAGTEPEALGASQPAERVVELAWRRKRLWACPGAVERDDPAEADDRVAERLALLVLAQLEVHPDQLLEHAQEAGALAPATLHRLPHRVEVGQQVGAHGIHDVLGVALEQRHERLRPLEQLATLGPDTDAGEAVLAQLVDEPAQIGEVR